MPRRLVVEVKRVAEERRLGLREHEHDQGGHPESERHELRPASRKARDDDAGDESQRPYHAGYLDQRTSEREKQCQRDVARVAAQRPAMQRERRTAVDTCQHEIGVTRKRCVRIEQR